MTADIDKVPHHLAIIMDGNGRWARARMLPRVAGHRKGVSAVRRIAYACADRGVGVLTLYSFSTENWKRDPEEVATLMGLIDRSIRKELPEFQRRGVQVRICGRQGDLSAEMRQTLEEHVRATEGNAQFVLNLAINYGARAEIVDAVRSIARDVRDGRLAPDDVTEDLFSDRLYTGGLPDPDLLIRTGGDMRISNFLLWQLAYTEFYITPTLWPDFDEAGLDEAFQAFRGRERRYGGVLGDAG